MSTSGVQITAKCTTCHLGFTTDQLLRHHFHSNIHDFNLKRKLLDLAPLTLAQFQESFNTAISSKIDNTEIKRDKEKKRCLDCGKSFNSEEKYNEHMGSKKHKERLRVEKTIFKTPEHKPSDGENICIFCNFKSEDIEMNLKHMRLSHNFFIPREDSCCNKTKLIRTLGQIIENDKECYVCFD